MGKWAKTVDVACETCSKVFSKRASEAGRYKRHFCSRECYKCGTVEQHCKRCGKTYETPRSRPSGYCSPDCYEQRLANVRAAKRCMCGEEVLRVKRPGPEGWSYGKTCGNKECVAARRANRKKPEVQRKSTRPPRSAWEAAVARAVQRLNSRTFNREQDAWKRRINSILSGHRQRTYGDPSKTKKQQVPGSFTEALERAVRLLKGRVYRSKRDVWQRKVANIASNWRKKTTQSKSPRRG